MYEKGRRRQLGGTGEWYKGRASHGTAVAAIAAGDGYTTESGEKIPPGIAPNANLYIYRLGDTFGREEVSAALDHILTLDSTRIRIDIVVMAFSLPKSSEKIEAQTCRTCQKKDCVCCSCWKLWCPCSWSKNFLQIARMCFL